jgi:hypothetical protein
MLLVQINFQDVNLLEFGVKNASNHHSSSFEAMHQIGTVEPVDVVPDGQDKIAPQMLD